MADMYSQAYSDLISDFYGVHKQQPFVLLCVFAQCKPILGFPSALHYQAAAVLTLSFFWPKVLKVT